MTTITIQATVNAPVEKVWRYYTEPKHIVRWNNASDDWHTTKAENDPRIGGRFLSRMEAKDGSTGFDFEGTYTRVKENELIEYVMDDERKVVVTLDETGGETKVIITFDAEETNPVDMQRDGWQAILNNFKKYVEKK